MQERTLCNVPIDEHYAMCYTCITARANAYAEYIKKGTITMSTNEMESKIAKLQEWESLADEAKAEAEALRDEIKAEMLARDTEELEAGRFICRWTSVLSNRFDTTSFKKEHADMYKQYTKQTASRRFSIA